MPHYTEKTEGSLPHHQTPALNLLGRYPAYQTGEHQASHGIPPGSPGINQHSPHTDWPPHPQKKKNLNNKQGTEREHAAEWAGCCQHSGEGGGARSWSPQELSVNKGWKGRRSNNGTSDKLLPKIGQIAVHKVHFLSQLQCRTAGGHSADLWNLRTSHTSLR
jgi:hypothetical protein